MGRSSALAKASGVAVWSGGRFVETAPLGGGRFSVRVISPTSWWGECQVVVYYEVDPT